MLGRLAKGLRIKGGLALAVLYALCVLTPSTALAFADAERAAHCLTYIGDVAATHTPSGQPHSHATGTSYSHAIDGAARETSKDDGKTVAEQCCGVFCITAVAIVPEVTFTRPVLVTALVPALAGALAGRFPDRLIKPPIA